MCNRFFCAALAMRSQQMGVHLSRCCWQRQSLPAHESRVSACFRCKVGFIQTSDFQCS